MQHDKKTVSQRVCLLLTAVGIATVMGGALSAVLASAPDAAGLATEFEKAMSPPYASKRRIDIAVRSPGGETVEWTGQQARKTIGDRGSMVTVLVGPESMKGFAVLVRDAHGEPDTQWVYLRPCVAFAGSSTPDATNRFWARISPTRISASSTCTIAT